MAAVLTMFYCFFMLAAVLAIIADMIVDGPLTPTGIFFLGLLVIHITAALFHPKEFFCIIHGFVYAICTPSGYLLLLIYSLVNMNNVSWGTRETKVPDEPKEIIEIEEKKTKRKWPWQGRNWKMDCTKCFWHCLPWVNSYDVVESDEEWTYP